MREKRNNVYGSLITIDQSLFCIHTHTITHNHKRPQTIYQMICSLALFLLDCTPCPSLQNILKIFFMALLN